MTTTLQRVRAPLTAFALLIVFVSWAFEGVGAMVTTMVPVGAFVVLLWAAGRSKEPERHSSQNGGHASHASARADFEPDLAHDNIALDTKRDMLWVRDASGAERYLGRGDLISWKTAHDWNNGTFRQRIEFDIRDVQRPRWQVLFQRHSDSWKTTSKRNGEERDEWFARLRAWDLQPPVGSSEATPANIEPTPSSMHEQYQKARTDEDRHNFLVAFDITCDTAGLDQKAEWERLGGSYPGPSAELLDLRPAKVV